MYTFGQVWQLCVYSVETALEWLHTFLLRTGAIPYFIAMFFVICGIWFLLDPIFGGSDRAGGRRKIDTNAHDTKRLGKGK